MNEDQSTIMADRQEIEEMLSAKTKARAKEYRSCQEFSTSFRPSYLLNHFRNLQQVGWQMFSYRDTSCIDDHISFLNKSSLFQNFSQVSDNIIHAFFFSIMKCTNTPAQAELVNQGFFF